jgi:hypothetical protein
MRYGIEVIFNGITPLLNFIKSTGWFKSYLAGGGTDKMIISSGTSMCDFQNFSSYQIQL